jgi:Ca2+/H+ antiporter
MVAGGNRISGFGTATEQADILKVSHGVSLFFAALTDTLTSPCIHRSRLSCYSVCFFTFATTSLPISRGIVYLSYLVFQLFSHKSLYDDTDPNAKPRTVHYARRLRKKADAEALDPASASEITPTNTTDVESGTISTNTTEDEEVPQLSVLVTVILLVFVTVLVAVTAEWLVDSIDGLASSGSISKEFIGLILLPIVGNAAEHVTAVTVSVKDKLTLSLGVAVGSSIVSVLTYAQNQH